MSGVRSPLRAYRLHIMQYIFQSNFIIRIKPPNLDELLSKLNEYDHNHVDNSRFNWGEYCKVDKVPLDIDEMMPYVIPSVDCISKELKYSGGYTIDNPWINLYSKGSKFVICFNSDVPGSIIS